jgi:hypothetical protein
MEKQRRKEYRLVEIGSACGCVTEFIDYAEGEQPELCEHVPACRATFCMSEEGK